MLVSVGHHMLCTLYFGHIHPGTRSCPHIPLELSHQLHLFKRLTCDLAQSLTLSRRRHWERQVTIAWRQQGSGQEPCIHGFTFGTPARGGNLVHCVTPIQLLFEPWNTQLEGIWTFLWRKLVFQFFLGNGRAFVSERMLNHSTQLQHWLLISMTLEQSVFYLTAFLNNKRNPC